MKRKLVRALTVAAIVVAGTAVAATPTHASETGGPVCIINQATWLRDMPWGGVLRTLSPGRGFRVHSVYGGSDIQTWYYGHGAEATWQDGWIPAANCNF
jgi:hypothetical protein